MRTATSIPQMHADQRGLKHGELNFGPNAQFRRYVFENDRKNPRNPRESAGKKLPGSCG
jgi:hypothetical protein